MHLNWALKFLSSNCGSLRFEMRKLIKILFVYVAKQHRKLQAKALCQLLTFCYLIRHL